MIASASDNRLELLAARADELKAKLAVTGAEEIERLALLSSRHGAGRVELEAAKEAEAAGLRAQLKRLEADPIELHVRILLAAELAPDLLGQVRLQLPTADSLTVGRVSRQRSSGARTFRGAEPTSVII